MAPRRTAIFLALGLPLALAAMPPGAPEPLPKNGATVKVEGFAPVRAEAVADNPATAWPGIQFVRADKQGRVTLLRGETLDLFALTSAGKLVSRGRLEGAEEQGQGNGWVKEAVLSPAGDVWVTLKGLNRLEIFRGGKSESRLDSKWLVSSIAAGDGPIVSVLPGELDLATGETLRLAVPPLIKEWDGKRWVTLTDGEDVGEQKTEGAAQGEWMRGRFGTLIAIAPNGQIWLADKNSHRLRRFTASGTLKDDLRVGDAEVAWSDRPEEDYERLEKLSAAEGFAFRRGNVSPVVAKPVYRALAVGRDGFVYLLAETKEGTALDRFDPSYPAYDRVLLNGLPLSAGQVTMAAGAHSLVLAPRMAKEGLWEIREEALADADWREVPDASVNGTPIPPREPGPTQAAR